MALLIELFRPIVFKFLLSDNVKKLVCDLVDAYVNTTDNEIDDMMAGSLRKALLPSKD